jgi:hypothetical protein
MRLGLGGALAVADGQQPIPGAGEQLLAGALAQAVGRAGPQLEIRALGVVVGPDRQGLGVVAGGGGWAPSPVTRSPASRRARRARSARSPVAGRRRWPAPGPGRSGGPAAPSARRPATPARPRPGGACRPAPAAGSGRRRPRRPARGGTVLALPAMVALPARYRNSLARRRSRQASTAARSRPLTAARAPTQPTRPSTDMSWSAAFSSAGRASRRAAMMAWTVSGRGSRSVGGPAMGWWSRTMRTYSSANRGLPPAAPRAPGRHRWGAGGPTGGSRAGGRCRPPTAAPARGPGPPPRCRPSPAGDPAAPCGRWPRPAAGRRRGPGAQRPPVPVQGGRPVGSSSSWRKSSRASSAQWRSSEHEDQRPPGGQAVQEAPPGGERLVTAARLDRGAVALADQPAQVPGRPGRSPPGRRPWRGRRPGQATPDPVGRVGLEDAGLGLDDLGQGPVGHPAAGGGGTALVPGRRAALAPADELVSASRARPSSATSRLLPMPGGPSRVTSCGRRLSLARRNASSSRPSFPVAADQRHRPGGQAVHAGAVARLQGAPHAHRPGPTVAGRAGWPGRS